MKRTALFVVVVGLVAVGCGDDSAVTTQATSTTAAAGATTTTTVAATTTTEAVSGGELIVFNRLSEAGEYQVFTVSPEGGEPTRLAEGLTGALMPVWSPDRSQIAFWSWDTGEELIWIMAADGSEIVQFTGYSSAVPDWWRPGGDALVYNCDAFGEPVDVPDLCMAELTDADDVTQLVDSDATVDFQGRVSPDGSRLLFVSDRSGDFELWVLQMATGELTNLTQNPDFDDQSGDWSPDGTSIAYVVAGPDVRDIWVMDADGDNQRPLIEGTDEDDAPNWSPDGTRIVFSSSREGGIPHLWIVDADGGNLRQLTAGTMADLFPDW
jgi:TolB protein